MASDMGTIAGSGLWDSDKNGPCESHDLQDPNLNTNFTKLHNI
jgi:hypothetical protein